MSTIGFYRKAPWVMELLMQDFPIGLEDAAAIVGNFGHESNGLQAINEAKPVVKGSRGGFGWAQWTASRRRDFEAYCERNGFEIASDMAQYKFVFVELTTTEKHAIPAVVEAEGLREKVIAFEKAFERAGVKHYDSRVTWAERALDAYAKSTAADRVPPWKEPGAVLTEKMEDKPVTTEKPETAPQTGGPVEKAIGAGKGAAKGSAVVGGLPAALIIILDAYGLLPEGIDTALFGAAVAYVLTAFGSFVWAVKGAYDAPKNSE